MNLVDGGFVLKLDIDMMLQGSYYPTEIPIIWQHYMGATGVMF